MAYADSSGSAYAGRRRFYGSYADERKRVKNAIALFACKNQLEQKVEEQSRIIQRQAEQLKTCADSIRELDYQMQEIWNKIDRSKG